MSRDFHPLPKHELRNGAMITRGALFSYLKRLKELEATNQGLLRKLKGAVDQETLIDLTKSEHDVLWSQNFLYQKGHLVRDAVEVIRAALVEEDGVLHVVNPTARGTRGWSEAELAIHPPHEGN